jgi:hypothetical protein
MPKIKVHPNQCKLVLPMDDRHLIARNIPGLEPHYAHTLAAIVSLMNGDDVVVPATRDQIARCAQRSERTIRYHLCALKGSGFIKTKEQDRAHTGKFEMSHIELTERLAAILDIDLTTTQQGA